MTKTWWFSVGRCPIDHPPPNCSTFSLNTQPHHSVEHGYSKSYKTVRSSCRIRLRMRSWRSYSASWMDRNGGKI
jgi:hypothetical protein